MKNEEQECQMQVLEKFTKSAICYLASLKTHTTLNLRKLEMGGTAMLIMSWRIPPLLFDQSFEVQMIILGAADMAFRPP